MCIRDRPGGTLTAIDFTTGDKRWEVPLGNLEEKRAGAGLVATAGAINLREATLSGNTAGDGGGLFAAFGGTASVVNSTLSGNAANVAGGGVYSAGHVTLHNATVSGNTARVGGGGAFVYAGTLTLRRSLLTGNAAPTGREAQRFGGTVAVAAHNLFGSGGDAGLTGFAPGAGDVIAPGAAAGVLLPLANNGGPTLTHALAPFSPAIDRAPSADCVAAPVGSLDQRGQPRNSDGDGRASADECDIGAVEAAAASVPQECPTLPPAGVPGVCWAVTPLVLR